MDALTSDPGWAGGNYAAHTDVADGLAPHSFDLVTANAPWVPEPFDQAGSPARRFAAGGPSGFELPRRFLDAAAEAVATWSASVAAPYTAGSRSPRRLRFGPLRTSIFKCLLTCLTV